jgi:hypothetical protein
MEKYTKRQNKKKLSMQKIYQDFMDRQDERKSRKNQEFERLLKDSRKQLDSIRKVKMSPKRKQISIVEKLSRYFD